MGVTTGEPEVDGPCAEVAPKPSSTMELTEELIAGLMFTVRWTVTLPADGTVSPDHVTAPPALAPPRSAETKLVLAGIGSVIVTPVAAALPMLRNVMV